jgi:hypothetical protein
MQAMRADALDTAQTGFLKSGGFVDRRWRGRHLRRSGEKLAKGGEKAHGRRSGLGWAKG